MRKFLFVLMFFGFIALGFSQDSTRTQTQKKLQQKDKFVDENGDGICDNAEDKMFRNRNRYVNRNRANDGKGVKQEKHTQTRKSQK